MVFNNQQAKEFAMGFRTVISLGYEGLMFVYWILLNV